MPTLKDKSERVREAIEILTKLKEVGIPPSDSGYNMTKQILDSWIADGESRSENIPFTRYSRYGEMVLPRIQGRPVSFVLRASAELKRSSKA